LPMRHRHPSVFLALPPTRKRCFAKARDGSGQYFAAASFCKRSDNKAAARQKMLSALHQAQRPTYASAALCQGKNRAVRYRLKNSTKCNNLLNFQQTVLLKG